MIKAIVFDCFGVLIDDAMSVLFQRLSKDKLIQAKDIMHASHRGFVTLNESNQKVAELLGMSSDEYVQAIRAGEVKNRQLTEYIVRLRKQYKTAILSNVGIGGIKKRFSENELSNFDSVIASGEIGCAKPDAEVYQIVASNLGVRPDECVFTDDNVGFCDGANIVGMKSIVYKDFKQFKRELELILASD